MLLGANFLHVFTHCRLFGANLAKQHKRKVFRFIGHLQQVRRFLTNKKPKASPLCNSAGSARALLFCNQYARARHGLTGMRKELRDSINATAWVLLRRGICKTPQEARAKADASFRCNAKTRKGTPCQARGFGKGGRCKNHGGMSTGPKTPEGKARSLAAAQAGFQRWKAAHKQTR